MLPYGVMLTRNVRSTVMLFDSLLQRLGEESLL